MQKLVTAAAVLSLGFLFGGTQLKANDNQDKLHAVQDVKSLGDRLVGVKGITRIGINLTWQDHGVEVAVISCNPSLPILLQRWHWDNNNWSYDGDVTIASGVTFFFDKQAHPNLEYAYLASQWAR